MPRPSPLPDGLRDRPFTRAQALAYGLTRRVLDGKRIVCIHPGVYRYADTTVDLRLLARAALLVLPADAALSHITAVQWRGLDVGPVEPVHISTTHHTHRKMKGVVVHRRCGRLHPMSMDGVPVLGPDRTFVDVATQLRGRELLKVGDFLVASGQTDVASLRAYAAASHLDGVQRARRIATFVRSGSASPRESEVRWELVRAGLPEPELNADIVDDLGEFLARGDLVYREWKVLVEYDGWQHERDAWQRQYDHLRRERLEANGWRVIVVTTEDFKRPRTVVRRVASALHQAGYTGLTPRFGA